ncbi:MAG: HEAT repeat domain-containing protein [Phycisphaerales bacterium]
MLESSRGPSQRLGFARSHAPCTWCLAAASLGLLLTGCDTSSTMRPGAKSVLEAFAPPSPEEAARMAIDEFDANRRLQGMQLLAGASFAGEPLYMELFRKATKDTDAGVRAVAVRAVGTHGQPEDVPAVITLLKDDDDAVRIEAARALQRLHNDAAITPLIEAINPAKEGDERVRRESALALGQYKDTRVAESLIAALDDESVGVNFAVRDSLRIMTGQDLGMSRKDWATWYREAKQPFAGGSAYQFPVYTRDKRFWEYLPFVQPPPIETPASPAGLSPVQSMAANSTQPAKPAQPASGPTK